MIVCQKIAANVRKEKDRMPKVPKQMIVRRSYRAKDRMPNDRMQKLIKEKMAC